MKKVLCVLITLLSLTLNSQIIKCHSIGTIPDKEGKTTLDYEKCDEQIIISQEFKMVTALVFDKKGEVVNSETMELYEYEENDKELKYTFKHSDSSELKYSIFTLFICGDCKENERDIYPYYRTAK
jgi:hypothetical protein